jgi:hypothetical protein
MSSKLLEPAPSHGTKQPVVTSEYPGVTCPPPKRSLTSFFYKASGCPQQNSGGVRVVRFRIRGSGFVVVPRNPRKTIVSCYSSSRLARFAQRFRFVVSSFNHRGTERRQRGRERILWIQWSGVRVPSSTPQKTDRKPVVARTSGFVSYGHDTCWYLPVILLFPSRSAARDARMFESGPTVPSWKGVCRCLRVGSTRHGRAPSRLAFPAQRPPAQPNRDHDRQADHDQPRRARHGGNDGDFRGRHQPAE